jgi:hypothetical protein
MFYHLKYFIFGILELHCDIGFYEWVHYICSDNFMSASHNLDYSFPLLNGFDISKMEIDEQY